MDTLILILSMTAFLVGSVVKKFYTDRSKGMAAVFMFNAVGSLVSAVMLFLWGGFGKASLFTLILGVLFGLIIALQAITNLKALEIGPMSYTQMIISFSTLISALSGAVFWQEKLELAHILGIGLMLLSFALSVERKEGEKAFSVKWLLLSLASFLFNGLIGVMQKTHQSSQYKGEINAFLVAAFVVSFVFSVAMWAFFYNREKGERKTKADKKNILVLTLIMVVCGACVAVNHKLNLYLSGVMDSAVFFPIVNGGGLITVTLAAVVLFKEKLSVKQWLGIAVGTASVVLLCNPF